MTKQLLFWVLMLLWLVVGFFLGNKPAPGQPWQWRGVGGDLLLFLLFLLLGWQEFGAPVK